MATTTSTPPRSRHDEGKMNISEVVAGRFEQMQSTFAAAAIERAEAFPSGGG